MRTPFAHRVGQHRVVVWRRAALLVLLCLGLAAIMVSGELHAALLDVLATSRDVIVRHPVQGALLFVLLAAISAMLAFVSVGIVVPVAVVAWGKPLSLLLLWAGWMLGGALAYGSARVLGRPFVRWLTSETTLQRFDRRFGPETRFSHILLLQLALPSEIPGYLLGLAGYPFRKYFVALALAELPYVAATVYLSAGFVNAQVGVVLAVGLAIAAFSVAAFQLLRRRLRR
jgi:uncharacterized membrane protein YdjX (TVP38/TMEM64 family)